jgi:hypothetical protein
MNRDYENIPTELLRDGELQRISQNTMLLSYGPLDTSDLHNNQSWLKAIEINFWRGITRQLSSGKHKYKADIFAN